MGRLPTPGGDNNVWGTVLNDYLQQAHNADGTLKDGSVSDATIAAGAGIARSKLDTSTQTSLSLADGATSSSTANTIVKRDSTGAFSAASTSQNSLYLNQTADPTTPVPTGQAAVWKGSDSGLYVVSQDAPTKRRIPIHWGSGTTFPATGVLAGDQYYRTDLFSPFTYNGSAWTQTSQAVGTKAVRVALSTGALVNNMRWLESDTGWNFRWDTANTMWVKEPGVPYLLAAGAGVGGGTAPNNATNTLIASIAVAANPAGTVLAEFDGEVYATNNAACYVTLLTNATASLTGATQLPGADRRIHNNGFANDNIGVHTDSRFQWNGSAFYLLVVLRVDPGGAAMTLSPCSFAVWLL